ncbi:hypothetical protein LWI28_023461 [Acer negundo]|uniref:Secreted protein n=1 Tax=Acer negundo TaxID=4023 RepID=A0AAD5NYZ3_ACENE|nr:hypothetical protein LWI28_023461 [Acer negundo]
MSLVLLLLPHSSPVFGMWVQADDLHSHRPVICGADHSCFGWFLGGQPPQKPLCLSTKTKTQSKVAVAKRPSPHLAANSAKDNGASSSHHFEIDQESIQQSDEEAIQQSHEEANEDYSASSSDHLE